MWRYVHKDRECQNNTSFNSSLIEMISTLNQVAVVSPAVIALKNSNSCSF